MGGIQSVSGHPRDSGTCTLTAAVGSLAEEYNLEQQYRKPFAEVWAEEKDHPFFGPLSERMGVRGHGRGPLLVSNEEMEAASRTSAFNTNVVADMVRL